MIRLLMACLLGYVGYVGYVPGALAQLAEIERIAPAAGGTVGVAVRHVESGREIHFNRGQRFPMGSTFKLPLAVQVLALVDEGRLSLDTVIALRPGDLRPGSGTLVKRYDPAKPDYSLRSLLELMMIVSDNSATDVLWKEAGGFKAVMARLRALGVGGISVDRPTGQLLAAAFGVKLPPGADATPGMFQDLMRQRPKGRRELAHAEVAKDPRDTATPDALVDLLLKIWRREALSPVQSAVLLDIMARTESGRRRLRGLLPKGTRVMHKTGTLTGIVTNDAGIIALPGGAGHVAIAVMVKESLNAIAVQERAIAEIARAVYDHFSTNPSGN
ncbi:MAG: class A beta-lactamase [Betaproteobacteria bacterium]